MSKASMKEQLQAVASQLSISVDKTKKPENKHLAAKKMAYPKPGWLDYVQYGVELLKAYFPATFKTASEMKPLKKGIKQDLVIRLSTIHTIVTEDKACMVKSLSYYVNTAAYHKSVVEGATRIDLEGHSAGIVSSEEAKYSIERQQAKLHIKKLRSPLPSHQQSQHKTE